MPPLDRFVDRFPKTLSLALGALAALGFPPLKLWPVALLAMGLMIRLLMRSEGWRKALLFGWLFGVAHFTTTNAWIATAFTHQSEMPVFLGWLAVPLLSLYLAAYPALAAAGTRAIIKDNERPLAFVLAFAGLWIVTEWLRGWLFTGFAWGPFSLALLGDDDQAGLAMLLPWFGTYALSGLAVLIAGAAFWAAMAKRFLVAGAVIAAVATGMLLPGPELQQGTQAYVLVQPDLDQREINDPAEYEPAFEDLSRLSARRLDDAGGARARRLVFWPESGLPDYLREGYPARYYRATTAGGDPTFAKRRLGAMLGENTVLLTGAIDLEIEDDRAIAAFNVVTALDDDGRIVGSYRKAHLVPYGEYLPMRRLLEPLGLSRLVAGTIEFWQGPGPRTLDLGDYGQAGVQICYEIVFSGQVVDESNRPDFLFNPSNDGWFGPWGPPQHFAQARMRAIEEGLPVLRSTTTGISGIIDANGIVRQSLGMRAKNRLDGMIPPAHEPTLFARLGNVLGLGWVIVLLALSAGMSFVAMRRRER